MYAMKLKHQTVLRLLAVILMTAGLFGGVSRAFALSGSGTQEDPYKITSEDDWKQFCIIVNEQNNLDSWAVLTADIDVNVSTASDLYQKMVGRPVPSGSSGLSYHSYKGTFDGHGHVINGLQGL